MGRGKVIWLTEKQIKELEPILEKARRAKKPGMLLGQFYDDHFDCGFIPYEKAIKIQKAVGIQRVVGRTITSAFDKPERG